jgi:hypothetical protein
VHDPATHYNRHHLSSCQRQLGSRQQSYKIGDKAKSYNNKNCNIVPFSDLPKETLVSPLTRFVVSVSRITCCILSLAANSSPFKHANASACSALEICQKWLALPARNSLWWSLIIQPQPPFRVSFTKASSQLILYACSISGDHEQCIFLSTFYGGP